MYKRQVLSDSKIKTVSYCINEMEQVLLSTDDDIIVIDTEGYYLDFAKRYSGNYITIGQEDKVFSDQLVNYESYDCCIDFTLSLIHIWYLLWRLRPAPASPPRRSHRFQGQP